MPRYGEAEDVGELSFEARALSFLGTWMLAPLVIIYAIIVLAYGAKVLVQWELPKGEIAMLVSPFLGVGMLVWLMLEPKVLKESGFVRFYRAAWHWIMLPAAVLLGVSVFVRIREYGFTPERFFLALVVIWALVQSLWFTVLPKIRRDIRFPTALAAGLLIFGAFGASPLSIQNQFQRGMKAKTQLPDFTESTIKNNAESATNFRDSLEYIVKADAETRFKALLPDYDMPPSPYGKEWLDILTALNLVELEENGLNSVVSYNFKTESPVPIPANSSFYGGYSIYLRRAGQPEEIREYITKQEGLNISFNMGDQSFDVDFNNIADDLKRMRPDTPSTRLDVPPKTTLAKSGAEITLIILGGNFTEVPSDGTLSGRLDVAFIVPN